ncbi:MAG: GLPGLI family protein [Fulvivirga sp.]|uniref:GLPGLI family protein n=1 Tax=Fulvivirga sp. TaxID=1931237 RepID=UPI0032EAEA5D
MKKILYLLALIPLFTSAQNFKGKITYEENRKLDIKLDGGGIDDEILKHLPKNQTAQFELLFNPEESLYRLDQSKKEDEPSAIINSHEAQIEFKIDNTNADNATYHDIKKEKVVEKRDFLGRTFLIKDQIEKQAWKITTDTKDILGYTCQKATYTQDSTEITAWYTTQIPLPIGPSKYTGLPGAVLEVSIDNGEVTYTANSLDLSSDYSDEIIAPKKGKEVSREEFNTIRDEKLKEMEEEFGGGHGGGTRVIIQKQ